MLLIFNMYSPNPDADNCAYATVNLTKALAERIFARAATFQQIKNTDSKLERMEFCDYTPDFLRSLPESVQQETIDVLDAGKEWAKVVDDTGIESLDDLREPTECNCMVIDQDQVIWTASPKGGDYYIETRALAFEDLKLLIGDLDKEAA